MAFPQSGFGGELSCLWLAEAGRLGGLLRGRLGAEACLSMDGCQELEADRQQGCLHTQCLSWGGKADWL